MLSSQNLIYRSLLNEDIATFHSWWNDSEFIRLQSSNPPKPFSLSEIQSQLEGWNKGSDIFLCIEESSQNQLVGAINIWTASSWKAGEMAIFLGPQFWGQKFGQEAVRFVIDHAFQNFTFERIYLKVHAFNKRAIRAYEKAGFEQEGTLRHTFFRDVNGRTK